MQVEFVRDLGAALGAGEPLAECWISSAYTSLKGARSLKPLIAASREKHAILGCNPQTEGAALQVLHDWGVAVQIMPDPPNGIFHPKCLYARGEGDRAWVLAGSANLTEGGLSRNIEAGFKVGGVVSQPAIREARKFFVDLAEAAAPLTPDLLRHFKEVQTELRAAMRQAAPATMGSVLGMDSSQALLLTPAGRHLVHLVDVSRFHHYIATTQMTASYKMVVLALLLQAPEGRLAILELARMFAGFYRLLSLGGYDPERSPMTMRRVEEIGLKKVVSTLKDEPRKALSRPGVVAFSGDQVEINRTIWEAMLPAQQEEARRLAVARMAGYYQEHLGISPDFSTLLYGAERTSFDAGKWLS
ncbi:MAG TPA: phospholipase D family protein [Symbiobacteriaceae bacterium]|nr:phospholipase D family protein [Symbiobacteriaceae bacterium]